MLRSMCTAAGVAASVASLHGARGQCAIEGQGLTNPAGAIADAFAIDVGISGEWVVLGASSDDEAGLNAGALHVYRRVLNAWQHQDKLLTATGSAGDAAGRDVAVDGDAIAAGAALDEAEPGLAKSGTVAVFIRDAAGEWNQHATLKAPSPSADDNFGWSLDLDGEWLVVAAPGRNVAGTLSGAAWAFRRQGNQWSAPAPLTPSHANVFGFFGESVSVDGTTAVIGAWGDNEMGKGVGAAYLFTFDGSSWSQQAKLTASDFAPGDEFGKRVAISGDRAFVVSANAFKGGPSVGAVYVFRRAGGAWTEEAKLTPTGALQDEAFGVSVAAEGPLVLVGGVWQDPVSGDESRWAYLFRHDGAWEQVQKVRPANPIAGEIFGWNAAFDGGTALISGFDKIIGGAAYFFDVSACGPCYADCNADGALTVCDFACFQTRFVAADPYADCYADGALTVADFGCFQTRFVAGCP